MENEMRKDIDKLKNFIILKEALKTKCQTEGAIYQTDISEKNISINIKIPFKLELDESEAKLLEANIHNVLELVLAPYFKKS